MLGNIALVVLQLAAGLYLAPYAMAKIPIAGDAQMFVRAAVYALIAWGVGLAGSFVLKDVRMPSTTSLASALVGGLVGAAVTFVPPIMQAIPFKFPNWYLPLGGAVLGYFVRR